MAKTKTNKNVTTNLSNKIGTVSYAITTNKAEIDSICMSGMNLTDAKKSVIDIITNNSNDCESRAQILNTINRVKSSYDLLMYVYNMVLAGDNLAVLA